jgi:TonB family protein
MRFAPIAITVILVLLATGPLGAQSRASVLVEQAHARLSVSDLDSAEVLLRMALASAAGRADSVAVFIARGVLAFSRGDESATSTAFHQALVLDSTTTAPGLARISGRLEALFEEQHVGLTNNVVYASAEVDEKPRRLGGPRVRFPPDLVRRQVGGRVVVGLMVDTLGHADPASIEIFAIPDSALVEPVRHMLEASTFSPGRIRKRAVRTLVQLAIDLEPRSPPPVAALIDAARTKLALHQTDSALVLLQEALDPISQASEAERVYGLLVMGVARTAAGQDSLSRATLDTALAGYRRLTDKGVVLAPFLKRLADSVSLARHGRRPGALGNPTVLTNVDVAPVIISQPPVRYPPEMQALRVGGTVTIEATLDATGHVVPGSVKVIQTPNPGLDAEARRVVAATAYHPARRGGRPVTTVIRQTITFVPY